MGRAFSDANALDSALVGAPNSFGVPSRATAGWMVDGTHPVSVNWDLSNFGNAPGEEQYYFTASRR